MGTTDRYFAPWARMRSATLTVAAAFFWAHLFFATPFFFGTRLASAEMLRGFEIRRAGNNAAGKLVAHVGDHEVNLSTSAIAAWVGWHPSVLLYSEKRPDGKYELNQFNAITGGRTTIATERLVIHDVTVAKLAGGEYTLILFLHDPSRHAPALALAHPTQGVFRRIANATAGPILNDAVEVRYYRPRPVDSKEQALAERKPWRVESIPLARK